jgi:hypothetical protein
LSVILEHPLITSPETRTEDFRPVQGLWAVSSATVILHPIVLNPYTLLGLIPGKAKFFTCLDLKEAFFCNCLVHRASLFLLSNGKMPTLGKKGN